MKYDKPTVTFSTLGFLPEYGGVENSIRYLAREARVLNYRAVVITAQTPLLAYNAVDRFEDAVVIRFRFRPYNSKIFNLLHLPFAFFDIWRKMRVIHRRYDVKTSVNRNQFLSFFAQLIFTRNVYVAPGFSKFQATPENLNKGMSGLKRALTSVKARVHDFFDRRALTNSDHVFVFSENMKQQAEAVVGSKTFQSLPLSITKPGVDGTQFSPVGQAEKQRLRKELGLPEGRNLVLSVGRFVSAKGFDYLAAASEYASENTTYVIVGDGPDRSDLLSKHARAIEQQKLMLPGKSSDTSKYYRACDVFVLSSVYEPLGQTLLEAAACGLPIVAFRQQKGVMTATKEIFGDVAHYVNNLSDTALSDTIDRLLNLNAEQFSEVGRRSREHVLAHCNWHKLLKQLLEQHK